MFNILYICIVKLLKCMKMKFYLLILASLLSVSSYAQKARGRIENVTNYELLLSQGNSNARKVGTRESAPLPCMGSPKVPVILVQFSDLKFCVADTPELVNGKYEDYFNLKTGNANNSLGSVYQYFNQQSGGQFTPEFEVVGPVTLSKGYAYYGENASMTNKDIHIRDFFAEACKIVVNDYNVDWKLFDNNNDGKVDFVFFIYAGEGENAGGEDSDNLIWPKEMISSMTIDNVTFGAYGLTNETYLGVMDGIGTAVHEISHGLGLPDFYDVYGICGGLDAWSVMDGGTYQVGGLAPTAYSAYERDFMGWKAIETLDSSKPYSLEIKPIEKDGVGYRIVNPANENEYFILENRQDDGMYDKYLGWPSSSTYKKYGSLHGLMITHVDYDRNAWVTNTVNTEGNHQRISIVPADGEFVSYVSQDYNYNEKWCTSMCGDLYPGMGNVKSMSSYAVYTGGTLPVTVDNIREIDGIIYLDINGGTIIPALRDSLNVIIDEAKACTAKMGKVERENLDAATKDAPFAAPDIETLEGTITVLSDVLQKAYASAELYKSVAAIIEKADALGDAGKESFAASGIKDAYDKGTIESIEAVQAAYDAAVSAQEAANGIGVVNASSATKTIFGLDGKARKDVKNGVNIINGKKVMKM